jgi:hypothetical protein
MKCKMFSLMCLMPFLASIEDIGITRSSYYCSSGSSKNLILPTSPLVVNSRLEEEVFEFAFESEEDFSSSDHQNGA